MGLNILQYLPAPGTSVRYLVFHEIPSLLFREILGNKRKIKFITATVSAEAWLQHQGADVRIIERRRQASADFKPSKR